MGRCFSRQRTINSYNVTGDREGNVGTADVPYKVDTSLTDISISVVGGRSKDIKKRTKEEIKLLTSGMIHVSAVDKVVGMLKSGKNWVTITGNAGDGKTTLGFLVLKKLKKSGVKVYHIKHPEEYELLSRVKGKRVLLLDDSFGAFMSDQTLLNKWRDVLTALHQQFGQAKNKTNVVFISRKNVLEESRDFLGMFKERNLDRENIVDLSSFKVKEERLRILDHYLKHSHLKESSEVKQRVADLDIAHGFPHCVVMYTKLKAKEPDIDIQSFFQRPLQFLDITTAVLYDGYCKNLFQLMIKNDGRFDANSVEDDTQRETLSRVEREQKGSYITVWKKGICEFAHPSIYESVLSVICAADPLLCVKYASLSVIRQKLTFSDKEMKLPTQISVEPVPAILKALAERFRPHILQEDYSVFTHRFCDNEDFCKQLLSTCVYSDAVFDQANQKQNVDAPGRDNKTMLWTALLGGKTLAIHALVEHGGDVNLPDETGNTPLLFMCRRDVVDYNLIREIIHWQNRLQRNG